MSVYSSHLNSGLTIHLCNLLKDHLYCSQQLRWKFRDIQLRPRKTHPPSAQADKNWTWNYVTMGSQFYAQFFFRQWGNAINIKWKTVIPDMCIDHFHALIISDCNRERTELVYRYQDIAKMKVFWNMLNYCYMILTHTLRIDFFRYFKCIRISKVRIGRRDGQDQAVFFANELEKHGANLHFNVWWLIANRNLGHARQVYQCQV